jgi:hypothetical protein
VRERTVRTPSIESLNGDGLSAFNKGKSESRGVLVINQLALTSVVNHSVSPFDESFVRKFHRDYEVFVESGILRIGFD